jgi:hypothetical protein
MVSRNTILAVLIAVIAVGVVYMLDPTLFGLLGRSEGFEVVQDTGAASSSGEAPQPGAMGGAGIVRRNAQGNGAVAGGQGPLVGGMTSTTSPSVDAAMAAPAGGAMSEGSMATEGFENLSPETMPFPEGKRPSNCYPKNQLAPQELLPNDPNSKWAQVNPMASGDIAGKNFLNAGALIGVNTVGQSLRNANWDIRAAPPNPQVEVSPWLQSTISPDLDRRPLDIA